MHGDDALWWIGFTGATAALIATDHQTEALIDAVIVSQVLKTVAGGNRPRASSEKQEFFEGGAPFPSGMPRRRGRSHGYRQRIGTYDLGSDRSLRIGHRRQRGAIRGANTMHPMFSLE